MARSALKRILYVEDEPDIRTVSRLALESIGGFEVEMCASGREAVDRAEAFAPDLILLDVMMPAMDGPTTLGALRGIGATARTPIVFMTAKARPDEIERYKQIGAFDVITKPFDPMTLSQRVTDIWERFHD